MFLVDRTDMLGEFAGPHFSVQGLSHSEERTRG